MKKKKSYMDRKNILSEDILSSFLKGLFKGMKQGIFGKKTTKSTKQAKQDLQKSIDGFNSGIQKMADAVNKYRASEGKPPVRQPRKLTIKSVMDDYGKGKL